MAGGLQIGLSLFGLFKSNKTKSGGFNGGGFLAGAALLGLDSIFGHKQVVDGPRLEDRSIQVAEYGWRCPTIYGTHRTAGSVIWAPPNGLTEHSNTHSTGGKQGGQVREFSYSFNGAIMVCDGPIERMAEITYNDQIIYSNDGTTERIDPSLVPTPPPSGDAVVTAVLQNSFGIPPAPVDAPAPAQTTYDSDTNVWSCPQFRIYGGSETQMPDSLIETDLGTGKTPAYRGKVVVVFTDFYIVPPLGTFGFTVVSALSDLGDVCLDLWAKCGVSADRIDVSNLSSETVDGFIIDDRSQAKDALEELARNHTFDWVHRDGKEVALHRGGTTVLSLPSGSLRVHDTSESFGANKSVPDSTFEDSDTISIPAREELEFHDAGRQYHQNIRASWRDAPPYRDYVDKHARSTSEVLSRPNAQRLVDIFMAEQWSEAQKFKFAVGTEYRKLTVGDPVTIDYRGVTRRVRITDAQKAQFGVLQMTAVPDDPDLYNAPAGEDSTGLTNSTIQNTDSTYFVLINSVPWADVWIEDFPHTGKLPGIIYAASVPETVTWVRDNVAIASNNFIYENSDLSIGRIKYAINPAIIGKCHTVLADYSDGSLTWDETNTLDIDLVRGSLPSATESEVLNGANYIYVGSELLQYRDATYVGEFDNLHRYTISGLLRGQRGTEWAMATHETGEPALLATSAVRFIQVERAVPNQEIPIIVYTNGATNFDSTTNVVGENLMPYSPVHIHASDTQLGDGSISLEWTNRTRFKDAADNFLQTGQQPPLGEVSEAYEVDVLNNLGGVVYTIRGLTSPSATYSAAQMLIDFGMSVTSIDVTVYQISQVIGRGHGATATITI
jgi:hypothetical protein